jgi:hypothetical protein
VVRRKREVNNRRERVWKIVFIDRKGFRVSGFKFHGFARSRYSGKNRPRVYDYSKTPDSGLCGMTKFGEASKILGILGISYAFPL